MPYCAWEVGARASTYLVVFVSGSETARLLSFEICASNILRVSGR